MTACQLWIFSAASISRFWITLRISTISGSFSEISAIFTGKKTRRKIRRRRPGSGKRKNTWMRSAGVWPAALPGDALGYAVEFWREKQILIHTGLKGLQSMRRIPGQGRP